MGHALNSPSSFFRRRLCPGSRRMEEGQPDTDNPHSLRGTAAHTAAEICLKDGKTPGYFTGQTVDVEKVDGDIEKVQLKEEDTAAIWAYYDYVSQRMDQMTQLTGTGTVVVGLEEDADAGIWLGRDDTKGNLDCSLFNGQALEIIDYKHGSGKAVEVTNPDGTLNDQPALYAIGKLATMDWTTVPVALPVTITIVQPRCPHPQGPIRSLTVPAHYLFELVEYYKRLAAATDDPDAPLVPGDEQCFFCKAKAICPALNKAAMEVFQPVQESVIQAAADATVADTLPPVGTGWNAIEAVLGRPADQLTLEHKLRALDAENLVSAWFKAIREDLTNYALDGNPVPQKKLVESTTHRKWAGEESAIIVKLSRLRTSKGEAIGKANVVTTKPLSPSQAEKQIRPLVTERTWKGIEKLIIKPPGKPVLVDETDPREAIKDASQIFEPVENPADTEQKEAPPAPWM